MSWLIGSILVVAAVAGSVWSSKVRRGLVRLYRSFVRLLRGMPLLAAVCIAVAGGVAVAGLALLVLRQLIHTTDTQANPIDITKLSLVVAGGVGGVVALVVAYRRQRDVEQGRFVERFGAAAAQLGASDVAVRIAGVYAMAGVADESTGLRRQQCIDVLCGYLRLPYSPELGGNHQTKLVLKRAHIDATGATHGEEERHLEYRQNDKEVRKTIVRVVADHLRKDAEYSWSANDFDFRTAHLEDADFSKTIFLGAALFGKATFVGDAGFDDATFASTTVFAETRFTGTALFNHATFTGIDALFDQAAFTGKADFTNAIFPRHALFNHATFSSQARFTHATFTGIAWFSKVTFTNLAEFGQATFGTAWFDKVTFTRRASFNDARFTGSALFGGAAFTRDAWFGTATFTGNANFDQVTFTGPAQFRNATFASKASFKRAAFTGLATFSDADFGAALVGFDEPRQWGPPPPQFDWDHDSLLKPANVTPVAWPPIPVP